MILKNYQNKVVGALKTFFTEANNQYIAASKIGKDTISYVDMLYNKLNLRDYHDRPVNGLGEQYPRFCLKIPTGGGKTILAIEAIRIFHNIFAQKRTGLVVWITHRDTIYRQTIEKLKDKNHIYRQLLDQCSGNKTIIVEKGQPLHQEDISNSLTVLMLMIQSAGKINKESMKLFQDSSGYVDMFPKDNEYSKHSKLLNSFPNLDVFSDTISNKKIIKTSLGNSIRISNPLIIVDEFHTMFSDIAKSTLDGLNPSMLIGLSATPAERKGMNVLVEITGQELKDEEMIKLDLHLHSPTVSGNWHEMINNIIKKRNILEKEARKLKQNSGIYIRPICLIQAERTGKEQRNKEYVHSEDVREYLISKEIPAYEIAVKSSELDEIKEKKLLSEDCEIRYIITKEALKEGWDCSFAYILGIIPNSSSETSMTQLVGRILRQPYAKKTGNNLLDESYIFFNKGDTNIVLNNVQKGFENEGLGDLVKNVSREAGPTGSNAKYAKIKKSILNKYPDSLYLPIWIMKIGRSYRRFSYDIDIKSSINYRIIDYPRLFKKEVLSKLNTSDIDIFEEIIGLRNHKQRKLEEPYEESFDVNYLAKRINEITDNAFIAYDIAKIIIKEINKFKNFELLRKNIGFITEELIVLIDNEKRKQELTIFKELIKSKRLIIAVSNDHNFGYILPMKCEVYPEGVETYKSNLFDKSDILSMNPLEKKVASLLDSKDNIAWWVRNKVANKEWYYIRGWKKGRIFPDFIAAKKSKSNSLELVYIIESKGQHLIGNSDTTYKKSVFDIVNKTPKTRVAIVKCKINDKFKFELIGQGSEESAINAFFTK